MVTIDKYDPAGLRFHYQSDVFESIRHPEDGEQLIGEAFFVVAEAPSGIRWHRPIGAVDWVADEDDEGNPVASATADINQLRTAAKDMADRLNDLPSPKLNPNSWHYAGACYGSAAYQSLGIEEETAALEREAESWG